MKLQRLFSFFFFLHFLNTFYIALSLRPLWREGVHWYHTIVSENKFFSDTTFYRYIDFAPQFPTLLVNRFFLSPLIENKLVYIYSFSYAFIGIFYFVIAWSLARSQILRLFLIVLYSVYTLPASMLPHMIVGQTMGIFAIYFVLFNTLSLNTFKENGLLTLISLVLFVGYESQFILVSVMTVYGFYKARELKNRMWFFAHLGLNAVNISLSIYHLANIQFEKIISFGLDVNAGWNSQIWLGFLITILIFTLLIFEKSIYRKKIFYFSILSLCLLFFLNYSYSQYSDFFTIKNYRLYVVPFAALFVVTFLFKMKDFEINGISCFLKIQLMLLVSISFLFNLHCDLKLTEGWKKGVQQFEQLMSQVNKCTSWRFDNPSFKIMSRTMMSEYALTYMSLALQKTRTPTKIILYEYKENDMLSCSHFFKTKEFFLFPSSNKTNFLNCNNYYTCDEL